MTNLFINLLPRKGAREVLRQRFFGKIKKGSLVVVAVYTGILVSLFAARALVVVQRNGVEEQVRQARVKVDAYSQVESQQVLLKNKLQQASNLIRTRRDWAGFLAQEVAFVPDESSITGVSLSLEGALRISFETPRLQEAALLLKALVQLGLTNQQVKSIALENVEKTVEGTYSFTVLIST